MKVKICCIKSKIELRKVIDEGVRDLGFVSQMPSGPGIIDDQTIKELALYAPKDVNTFLLTSRKTSKAVIQQWSHCRTTTIQLCWPFSSESLHQIEQALPDVNIVPVLHVNGTTSLKKAHQMLQTNHSILLDTGNPKAKIPTLGGTGATHNWGISQKIRRAWPHREIWLAGGLNAANVQIAIRNVDPSGVDVCSGVRTNDQLDFSKLRAFLKQVATASRIDGSPQIRDNH